MPFGILEDHKLDCVPGTGLLATKGSQLVTGDASTLKRGTGRHSHIVLIPQPSDDPRDTLNWPRWRKEACFWTLVFMTGLGDTLLFFASPGYFVLAKEFNVSVNEVASSFSTALAGGSAFMLLQIPISVKYGHRIVYLLSSFLMFVTCVWVALSPNLTSIRASRVFQGFGVAASRSLVASTIEHLFFVHERGSRSSMWIICQLISQIIGILTNGYVIQLLSWRHGFWFANIACGLCFIGVLLFVPETTYRRQAWPKQEPARRNSNDSDETDKIGKKGPRAPPSRSFSALSYLKIYNGTFSDESVWKLFLGLFSLILSPVTWFSFVSSSIPSILFLFVMSCSSTIFTVTYGFTPGQIGLTNVGSIVGIVLALITASPLSDWWIVWMARRNRGIYEPEFRLFFTFSLVVGALSYTGWAIGNDRHMPWIGAVACFAMTYFAICVAASTRAAYVIDTHAAHAAHILALTESATNLITYGATFFANGVVLSAGVKRTLLAVAACQAACWLACIPVYVCGKRVRSFIARHPRLFCVGDDLPPSSDSSTRGCRPASLRESNSDCKC
ncbi:MFS general substrate transporter [Ganoderma sinense ZZ0214-1]|uniref:MFS general substrate transporter n=1 Tax=Ganoderma sinense ZZ0214-1 TaxID=1077348 RepID=A0A2G8SBT3_9APHY|nr:MFS general substrate transporter [Ganoderma sinense ZZ0214-1]